MGLGGSEDTPSEVRALDSTTGDPQWKTKIDADYPEVAATKQGVIVATNTVLYSLDPVSGTIRWQQQGGPLELSEARYVSTPVIHEDMVYATVDDTLFAFNIETGTKQWTADGVSEITLVGTRLYGMRGLTFVGLDVTTGQQQTEYQYSGEGRIDMIVPLDGMLLTRLYRYFDVPQDQRSRIAGKPLLVLSEDESRSTEDDDSDSTDEATETPTQTPTSTPSETTLHTRTETATQTTPTATLTDPRTQTYTSTQTTSTLTHSNPTEAATTTASAERPPSPEESTATDGPGFGVLSTLAAAGVGLWRSRRRE